MKKKKIIMIIILIIFIIGIIGIVSFLNKNKKYIDNSIDIQIGTDNTKEEINSSNVNSENVVIRTSEESPNVDLNNMVVITDNFFIQQTNDIYINPKNYIGKTIKIEGLVYSYEETSGDICYAVVRNTPGCCGSDGLAGIDIRYNKDYPELDKWIEVVGVIGSDIVDGENIPVILVSSITEKEAGKTFVTN